MGNIFSIDSPVLNVLSKLCDMLFLSVLWVFLCIPIVTIGPATTALYYTTVKVIRRERGYLFREFFKSFKMNFKRGAIVGVILTLIFVILFFDINITWQTLSDESTKGSILMGVYIALTFLVISFTMFAFPILSRFEMTVKQLIKASVFMSMKHLPFTFVMLMVVVGGIVLTIFFPMMLFFAPAIVVFINSFMMEHILKKYMPKSEGPGEETGKDEWYLE
jgi:uncharacterized membrane protein YesL